MSEYHVDAQGAEGILVGEHATQVNYFYRGTWTDGVAPGPLISISGEIVSPYRGLGAFAEQDAAFFCGRDNATADVLAAMSRSMAGSGLVVVSGVSGAGKSSLLRAGVLHRLRGAGLRSAPEAARWPCLVLTPGPSPLDELALRVSLLTGTAAVAIRRELTAEPASFALTARQAALAGHPPGAGAEGPGSRRRVLLVVDQAEQLFIQCQSEQERSAFISALHAAATEGHGASQPPSALVVLVVRADFEARLADYPQLTQAVRDRYLLTAMTTLQLRVAITEPAIRAGSRVDDDLVRVLLAEATADEPGQPGAGPGAGVLPLLSHVLDQAWRGRAGPSVTLADYERAGGVEGAVAASAERAYRSLTPALQAVARQVFTRLTATNDDGTDTAARASPAELAAGEDSARACDVAAVLEAFVAARLLTVAAGTVEISHEALLTAWPLLREWLADTRADRVIRTQLQATAREWDRGGRDPAYLYGGSRLAAAADAAARIGADIRHTTLSAAERDFLRASTRAGRRRARQRQGLIAILLSLVIVLAVVAVVAVRDSDLIGDAQDHADSLLLAGESAAVGEANATAAAIESIAAWGLDQTAQARYAMLAAAASPETATLSGDGGAIRSIAYSPASQLLAVGDDGGAELWNTATGQASMPLRVGPGGITAVAFSPDGRLLATGDGDGTVQLWNPATGRQAGRAIDLGSEGTVDLAFSPRGTILAAAVQGESPMLWDVASGRAVALPFVGAAAQQVLSLAFSPDGKTLATGGYDGTVRLWNLATGRQTAPAIRAAVPFQGDEPTGGITALAFSPDGKILVTVDSGGTVRLWNRATGRQVWQITNTETGNATSIAFSPDGSLLATGGSDGTVRLSNAATGPIAHSSFAFGQDGATLATVDGTGAVQWWQTSTGQQTGRPVIPGTGQAVNPDGALVFGPGAATLAAVGDDNGTIRLWNTLTGRQAGHAITPGSAAATTFLALGRHSMTLAVAAADGAVQVWDTSTGQPADRPFRVTTAGVSALAFSPDGQTLADGDRNGDVRLWDVATGRQIGQTLSAGAGQVSSVAFSPDGKLLAAGDGDGTAWVWYTATGQQYSGPLNGGAQQVMSVAFSPDGTVLATGDNDGTARLWYVPTGQQIGTAMDAGPAGKVTVAFSPDGTTLATTDGDGAGVQLRNVSYLTSTLRDLCARIGGSVTPAEWARYVPHPGPAYRRVCP